MTGKMKLALALGVLCSGLLFVSQAQASIFIITNPYTAYNTTLGGWAGISTGGTDPATIRQQDKDWTFVSASTNLYNNNPDVGPVVDTNAQFGLVTDANGDDHHYLTLADAGSGQTLLPGIYDLEYTIALNGLGPENAFLSAVARRHLHRRYLGYRFNRKVDIHGHHPH